MGTLRLCLVAPHKRSRPHKTGHNAAAIEGLFVALFLETHQTPPKQTILGPRCHGIARSERGSGPRCPTRAGNPLHGHQEGRFFHGYHDGYCCLPLYVLCGEHLLAVGRSNIDASAGAKDEVERIVGQIRARWPRIKILLRADSGFAREALMAWCEANAVDDLFGLARNDRLVGAFADDLAAAAAESSAKGGSPARRFADLAWSTAGAERVVAKAEHLPKGANPTLRRHLRRARSTSRHTLAPPPPILANRGPAAAPPRPDPRAGWC